ncbi:MAG: nucleotidyltransferase family protein, partial [Methanocellales archaeon]|nr:nucleotidyltransferase family protein [Methanocellales archaeon]
MGVIPAAGFGERMLPLTGDTPKALLPILNKPLISYIIERMQDIGVEDILVITGHLGEQIEREIRGVKFIRQRKIEGAAKAIKLVKKYVGEDFLLIWGDNFFQGDLTRLFSTHFERRADVSFILDERKIKKSAVAFIENGKITRIEERPKEGA